ncbi:putative H/ACA ribonucleoprotein complex, subunit Gar1/Naf1 [Helianthus debilis subsp. tardiflorus]
MRTKTLIYTFKHNLIANYAEVSSFVHACEGDAVTKLTNEKIPYFNAPIYLQNKTQIGKVDEIFGPINESFFSVKMLEGIIAASYAAGDKFYIDPAKLLPLARFLPQPKYVLFVWFVGCVASRGVYCQSVLTKNL